MNIQNISGTDNVPTGFSVNSEIAQEEVRTYEEERVPSEVVDETKGQNFDSYA